MAKNEKTKKTKAEVDRTELANLFIICSGERFLIIFKVPDFSGSPWQELNVDEMFDLSRWIFFRIHRCKVWLFVLPVTVLQFSDFDNCS